MKLFEQGKFRLNDKVTDYIPEFQGGKSDITLRNLFTHFSGLKPDVPLAHPWSGYQTGIHLACTDPPDGPPGARFVYSDINFILLGELVHRLSGQMLSDYARRPHLPPAGHEGYDVPAAAPSLLPRIAPTERAAQGQPAAARRGARPHGAQHGRRGRARRRVLHRRRSGALRADDAQRRRAGRRAHLQPAHRRRSSPSRRARPISRFCAGSAGTSIRPTPAIAASCSPSARSATPASPALRIWIDPPPRRTSFCWPTACTPRGVRRITPLRGKVATIAAAAVGIRPAGVTLTGYNETFTAAGVHREVARNARHAHRPRRAGRAEFPAASPASASA